MDDMQRYQPKPGSPLHAALQAQQEAAQALQIVDLKLASLKRDQAAQRAFLDGLLWDTPPAKIVEARGLLAAYDVLIGKANAERKTRFEAVRAASTPAHQIIDPLQRMENRLAKFQKYYTQENGQGWVMGMPAHLAAAEIEHLQTAIAAHIAANC